jgi:hypothetical protein
MRLGDLDGRTRARREAERLFREMIADMGGEEQVSAGKRALAEAASVTKAMCDDVGARFLLGESIDPAGYATLTNSLRRLVESCGLERRVRDAPTLQQYLAARSAAA